MLTTTPGTTLNSQHLQDPNRPVVDYTINEILEAFSNKNFIKNGTSILNKIKNDFNYFDFNRISNGDQSNTNDFKEPEINRGFMTSPLPFITQPTRPITNTFNLLKRKTSKPNDIFLSKSNIIMVFKKNAAI